MAVIKPPARNTPDALVVLDRLQIRQAFDVGVDLILVGVDELIVLDRGLGRSLDEAVGIVQDVFTGATRIWDDFGALTARSGPDLLLELGITPGSLLTGRVLRQGSDLSPQSMRAVTNIGNDLAEIADVGQLSDEAAGGLARLTNSVGDEGRMRRVLDGTGCALKIGAVSPASDYSLLALFDADPVYAEGCNIVGILQAAYNWDDAAVNGWLKISSVVSERRLGEVLGQVVNNSRSQRFFSILGGDVEWDVQHFEFLVKVFKGNFDDVVFQQIDDLKNIDGIERVVHDLAQGANPTVRGGLFELDLASELGADNIQSLAVKVNSKKGPDILLKDGRVLEAKAYSWSDMPPDFIRKSMIEENIQQIVQRTSQYPGAPIEIVFKGAKPTDPAEILIADEFFDAYQQLFNSGYKHVYVRWQK